MDTAHNRHSVEHNTHFIVEHNTHFIVIAASLVFWVPSLVLYCIHFLSQEIFPDALVYIFTMLHLTNSLLNPIIYSLRMPLSREALKRFKVMLKIEKKFKRYTVNNGI